MTAPGKKKVTWDFCYEVQLGCIVCVEVVRIMEMPASYKAIVFYFFRYYDQMSKKGLVEVGSLPEMILFRKSKTRNISVKNK